MNVEYFEISAISNIVGDMAEDQFLNWLHLDMYCNPNKPDKDTLLAVYEELRVDGTMPDKEIYVLKLLESLSPK